MNIRAELERLREQLQGAETVEIIDTSGRVPWERANWPPYRHLAAHGLAPIEGEADDGDGDAAPERNPP